MDDAPGPYRRPDPPPPISFPLQIGAGARFGMLGGFASFGLSLAIMAATGRVFVLGLAVVGPALAYLVGGATRLVEVHHDRIVLRSWLQRPRILIGQALFVQQMPDEMVLVHERDTYTIRAEQFTGDSFVKCAEAMKPVARRFLVRAPKVER